MNMFLSLNDNKLKLGILIFFFCCNFDFCDLQQYLANTLHTHLSEIPDMFSHQKKEGTVDIIPRVSMPQLFFVSKNVILLKCDNLGEVTLYSGTLALAINQITLCKTSSVSPFA